MVSWVLQGTSDPVKAFDRTANLEGTQIINYRVDAAEKWSVLIGIAPGAQERWVPHAGRRCPGGAARAGHTLPDGSALHKLWRCPAAGRMRGRVHAVNHSHSCTPAGRSW